VKTEAKNEETKKLEIITFNSIWKLSREECNMGPFLQYNT
jgi:hypothetical protein